MPPLTNRAFRALVCAHYRAHGRHDLPWRLTRDPYRILVSEIMLQQTQVPRVLVKYGEFIRRFPTLRRLDAAPLRDVLSVWVGLGYNRRALLLKKTAEAVVETYGGKLPDDFYALVALPGIGKATAAEILAFAFNKPYPLIETNIRAVYLHHFFPGRTGVADRELLPLIERTLDRNNPRQWYYALMDYGVALKKNFPNPSRKSAHHVRQSKFSGSLRQARGMIVRELTKSRLTAAALCQKTGLPEKRLARGLRKLLTERMISKNGSFYSL
jgi:A/G-specific adenine glycosylase